MGTCTPVEVPGTYLKDDEPGFAMANAIRSLSIREPRRLVS